LNKEALLNEFQRVFATTNITVDPHLNSDPKVVLSVYPVQCNWCNKLELNQETYIKPIPLTKNGRKVFENDKKVWTKKRVTEKKYICTENGNEVIDFTTKELCPYFEVKK
jgi:hypothetical protein